MMCNPVEALLDIRQCRIPILLHDVSDDARVDVPYVAGMAFRQLGDDLIWGRVLVEQAAHLGLPLAFVRQLAEERPVEVVVTLPARLVAQLPVVALLPVP